MVSATATLVALLMSGVTSTSMAQTTKTPPGRMPQHQEGKKDMKDMKDMKVMKGMQGMHGMNGMMGGPHHVLAMAYRDNLATFAKALQGQVTQTKSVNLEMARPAVSEMRRSFDQIREHHQAQMKMMGDHTESPMPGNMKHMETHLTSLGEHLSALESEIGASMPDHKKVSEHTAEILKQCAGMSAMPGTAKTHKMKS